MSVRYFLLIFILFQSFISAKTQISYGGKPLSKYFFTSVDSVPVIDMPAIDDSELNSLNSSLYKSKIYAKAFNVDINTYNSGIWIENDRYRIWKLGIRSKNAKSIILTFSPFYLPEGAELFIYNKDYSKVLGSYTFKNNKKSKILSIEPLIGEIAYIELILPKKFNNEFELNLKHVGHGLLNINDDINEKLLSIGNCHPDANCYIDNEWENIKNSTFFFIYYNYREKVYKYCNGTLINNTRQDGHPYFLSANHCLWDDSTANSVTAFFNYETRYCNGPELPLTKTISGANMVATINKLDYSLSEFEGIPPFLYKPFYAGWDRITQNPENVVCIHHPADESRIYPKMVAYDYDELDIVTYSSEYDRNSHFLIERWDMGTTEPGSSGCAIFNQDKRIIGDLTGGEADCTLPIEDYFTRFSFAWDKYSAKEEQLKYWLDPVNTGVGTLDGYDPYQSFKDSCDTLYNVTENPKVITYNNDFNFISGHNEDGIQYYAQYFEGEKINVVSAVYFNVAYARAGDEEGKIKLILWSSNGGEPGAIISEKEYLVNDFQEQAMNYLEFDSLITINGNFFIGYQIFYPLRKDTFALYQSDQISTMNDNFYIYNEEWNRIDNYTDREISGVLDIKVVRCNPMASNINNTSNKSGLHLNIYPNPAQNYVLLDFNSSEQTNLEIRIYNMAGKLMPKEITPISFNLYNLNLRGFLPGVYFISIQSEKEKLVNKIIVFK
ncbi:T9SS type A sorting domain-containing protein [Bacteroidota bacterium]